MLFPFHLFPLRPSICFPPQTCSDLVVRRMNDSLPCEIQSKVVGREAKRKVQVRAVFFLSANNRTSRWSESELVLLSPLPSNVQDPGPCLSSAALLHVRMLYSGLSPRQVGRRRVS